MRFPITIFQILAKQFIYLSRSKVGYPINAIYHFLYSYLRKRSRVINVAGHKMSLNVVDVIYNLVFGLGEPLETEILRKEIKNGDVVLDLGANIGFYTLIAAKLVGKRGRVFAFEPEPANFARLEMNVRLNGYENVVLVQKAVSNRTSRCTLYLSDQDRDTHRIYDIRDGRRFIEVESIRLDDYFHNQRVDFIKMDIEGAEWAALQGMSLLLEKNKRVKILTEFLPSGLKGFGIDPKEYLRLLIKYGFKLYSINERKRRMEPATIGGIMSSLNALGYINILCKRLGTPEAKTCSETAPKSSAPN